ncbi:hypothetical protein [Poseidonia sp.]
MNEDGDMLFVPKRITANDASAMLRGQGEENLIGLVVRLFHVPDDVLHQ